ncbi:LapA family protein [Nocardia sp. CDC153]|uniref:LapA family protein n=1 Tax=Nocardia sp. CDC153 TaxID=3112167 RepID=UPI002DBD1CA1|nr:LapA family protein [Nocardia sp. CDC153]MEC3957794.1 LapA family protein [Nocardia sp. CDC153]
MFTIIGLIALLGAVTVGVAGVQANSGDSHRLPSGFTIFDHTYGGSSGLLFAYGILVGAVGTAGFILLLAGLWTTSRRGVVARRELRQSRREMAAARKELAKPAPEAKPARSVDAPRQPVVPMAKTSQQKFTRPNWPVNPFRKGGGTPQKESVAK